MFLTQELNDKQAIVIKIICEIFNFKIGIITSKIIILYYMKKRIFLILIALFFFTGVNSVIAQKVKQPKTGNTKQQIKRLNKLEEQKIKDQKDAEKDLLKGHKKLQDKSTRKMMKKSNKKSKRIKKGKRSESFWKKLFRKQ